MLARLTERLLVASALAGVAAYGAATLVTVADILARQWGHAVPGVVDVVQLFVLAGAYLVIPYAFLSDAHVAVELLTDRLRPTVRVLLKALAAVLALALLIPMLVKTYGSAMSQLALGDRSQTLGIPMILYWAPVVVGLGLSLVALALVLARTLFGLGAAERREPEAG